MLPSEIPGMSPTSRPVFILFVAGLLLLAGPAYAQSAMPADPSLQETGTLRKAAKDRRVEAWGVTVAQVDKQDVFTRLGERLGEAEDILEDRNGKMVALVVELGGEATGEQEYVVPLERVWRRGFGPWGLALATDLDYSEIRRMPEWHD